jgi:hypothetical protein
MMTIMNPNLEIFKENNLDLNVTVKDDTGTPMTLAGATIAFKVGAITQATSGVTITNGGAAGTIRVQVTAAAMAALTSDRYDLELRVTWASGKVETLFVANLQLKDVVI